MNVIKKLQRLLITIPSDLKIVCSNNQIVHSHKILFGLLHASLEEIFIKEEFTNQTATIFLPIYSEHLKTVLTFDSIEDSTNVINNIFKCNFDPEPLKPVNDVEKVKPEATEIEDLASECIYEPVEDENYEDEESINTGNNIIENKKNIVKKVKLADLLNNDIEDLPEHQTQNQIHK